MFIHLHIKFIIILKEVKRSIDVFEETQKNQVQAAPYQKYVIMFGTCVHTSVCVCVYENLHRVYL